MYILKKLARDSDIYSHAFIHPFIKGLLNIFCGPDTMVGAGDTAVRRKSHGPWPLRGVVCE